MREHYSRGNIKKETKDGELEMCRKCEEDKFIIRCNENSYSEQKTGDRGTQVRPVHWECAYGRKIDQ